MFGLQVREQAAKLLGQLIGKIRSAAYHSGQPPVANWLELQTRCDAFLEELPHQAKEAAECIQSSCSPLEHHKGRGLAPNKGSTAEDAYRWMETVRLIPICVQRIK